MTDQGVLRVIYWITRRLIRPRVFGPAGGVTGAAVLVANHSGAFGPIMVMSSLPFKVRPWVTFEITKLESCAAYLNEDFTAGELRLREPLSRFLAELISPICVLLMKRMGAVPVYRNSRRIARTLALSRRLLGAGEKLVIFPEKPGEQPGRDVFEPLGELDTGFLTLARTFYEDRARELPLYPVAVNREARSLAIGSPLFLDPQRPFAEEKRRIKRQLQERIAGLCLQAAAVKSSSSR